MEAPEETSRPRMRWPFYAATALLVPVLYVLSIGPAKWLYDHGFLSESPVLVVYFPLIWFAEEFPILGKVIEMYVDLW